jgi:hypothetical protein
VEAVAKSPELDNPFGVRQLAGYKKKKGEGI